MVEVGFEPNMNGLGTESSAHHIVNPVFHPQELRSVVDAGCDTGTFLSRRNQLGVTAAPGLDGKPAWHPGQGAQITSTSSGPPRLVLGLTIGIWTYAAQPWVR